MRRMLLAGIVVTLVGGCAPSLSPLYRDYRDEADAGADVYSRIERALDAAEWSTRDAVADNVVATEPRSIRSWGIYSVEIELEVVPLAGNHVRVFVNPYRHFFQGTRRKVPYLRNSWARSLRDLTESLEAEGLTYEGTAIQRVREAGVR